MGFVSTGFSQLCSHMKKLIEQKRLAFYLSQEYPTCPWLVWVALVTYIPQTSDCGMKIQKARFVVSTTAKHF
jgi:hypothetical protein